MALIKQIATVLELLVVGSKVELLTTIEGKLDSSWQEHQIDQVVLTVERVSEQALLQLVAAESPFLQAALPVEASQASDAKRGSTERVEMEGELSEGDNEHDTATILEM